MFRHELQINSSRSHCSTTIHKRLVIWLHLTICDPCPHFAEQLAFIRKASRSILEYAEYISPTRFPESAKKRIK
jgi:hypothetical protein